jgi:hypothetical protein
MLRSEASTLSRKLAQPFGVNAVSTSGVDADCAEQAALLHQTRKRAVTGRTRRVACPSQPTDRRALFCRQESIERIGLRWQ